MGVLKKLRSLTTRDGRRRCGCRPSLRLYATPEEARRNPNETPVETIISIEGRAGVGEGETFPMPWGVVA